MCTTLIVAMLLAQTAAQNPAARAVIAPGATLEKLWSAGAAAA